MTDMRPRSPARRALLATGAAALLGACTTPARYAEKAELQWPADGRFAEVEGLRIHFKQEGPVGGPSAILIHGMTAGMRDMTFMLSWHLSRAGFRVTSFDRPGHGYSDRAPVEGWRPATQARILHAAAMQIGAADGAAVLGHCWGASVALAWGLLAPRDTRGIVCVSGLTMPWGQAEGTLADMWSSPFATAAKGIAARFAVGVDDGRRVAGLLFRPQDPPAGYLNHVGGRLTLRDANFKAAAEDVDRLHEALEEQVPLYPSLTVPTRILHGAQDRIALPAIHAVGLDAALPDASCTLMDGIGHMPHHAAPETVVAAMRAAAGA